LQVDWNKQVGIQTHFVLVKDKKGNDYVLYDPYKYAGDGPGKEVLLTSRYKYNGAKLESEISAVLWFDSYSSQLPDPPKMTKVPVTKTLVCVEPANQAIPKVGVQGQWLRVRDATNKEGYVAAWFVRYASGSSAQQAGTATTGVSNNGGPLKVRATVEGIALRN